MNDPKVGEDVELEQWANAILAQDADAEGLSLSDYKGRHGIMRRRHRDEIIADQDTLAALVNEGRAAKVP